MACATSKISFYHPSVSHIETGKCHMKQFERDIFDPNITNGMSRICGLRLTVGAIIGQVIKCNGAKSFLEMCSYV